MATRQTTELGTLVLDVKHYEVKKIENKTWAILECPHKDCKGEFKVKRKKFKESRSQVGRSCPYCFRVSGVPGADLSGREVIG